MLRHHETEMLADLDDLYLKGAVSIPWEKLYLRFNVDRLAKGSYREIIRLWQELCANYGHAQAPDISILTSKDTLFMRLIRDPFKGKENVVRLDNWT